LRTLLFAALMGVVTANNHTNDTDSTAAPNLPNPSPTTAPTISKKVVYQGDVTFTPVGGVSSGNTCKASLVCVTQVSEYIMNSISNSTGATTPSSVTIISMSDGSIKAKYSANYPAGTTPAIPTKEALEASMALASNLPAGSVFSQITSITSVPAVAKSAAGVTSQENAGTCTFESFSDVNCLTPSLPATTNTVLVATPGGAVSASPAKATGNACGIFPGTTTDSISVGSFYPGSTFSYATNGALTCVSQVYIDTPILGVTCIKSDTGAKYVRVQCAKTVVASTSNAVGAGLSAVATVVAFLMM